MATDLRVLLITSEWPTSEHPEWAPFIVRQVEYLRKAGVDVDVFSFRGAKNPLNYARAWGQVRQLLKVNQKYDLIHAQFGQSAFLALPLPCPLVVTYHGSDVLGIVDAQGNYTLAGWALRLFSQLVSFSASGVIVVSKEIGQSLPRRDFHIIPSGLNMEMFVPMPKADACRKIGLDENRRFILFGASPSVARKRFALAQSAFRLVAGQVPNAELISLNHVPHNLVPFYVNASDVLLLVSLHEGSPNVVKEALACNVPVVSTDTGDVRELIGAIEGCVLCDDDRPETIASALLKTLERNQRINGRQTVLDLNEDILTQKVIRVYRQAIEMKKA